MSQFDERGRITQGFRGLHSRQFPDAIANEIVEDPPRRDVNAEPVDHAGDRCEHRAPVRLAGSIVDVAARRYGAGIAHGSRLENQPGDADNVQHRTTPVREAGSCRRC